MENITIHFTMDFPMKTFSEKANHRANSFRNIKHPLKKLTN